MARTPSYQIVTLTEWMLAHREDLEPVAVAFAKIFDLPGSKKVQPHLAEEIENQARLLLFLHDRRIVALAGWNLAQQASRTFPVYLGVDPEAPDPKLRDVLMTKVVETITAERYRSDHTEVKAILLQHLATDELMLRAAERLGYLYNSTRNQYFKRTLGCRYPLSSIIVYLNTDQPNPVQRPRGSLFRPT